MCHKGEKTIPQQARLFSGRKAASLERRRAAMPFAQRAEGSVFLSFHFIILGAGVL